MGENIQYKRFLPLVILAMSILLQGCKDDVFNPEKVKAAYQDRFPVKNIDPAMDWKMTQQVRVYVLDRKPVLIGCFHFFGVKNIVFTTLQQYAYCKNNKRQKAFV